MNESDLFAKTGGLISNSIYESAIALYDDWNSFVKDQADNYDEKEWEEVKECYYEPDGSPSIDRVADRIQELYRCPQGEHDTEDILGDNYTEEEEYCYYEMSPEEIEIFVKEGTKRFELEKKEQLYYICENVRCPGCENGDSEEVVELDMPLYEDYKFIKGSRSLDICDLKQLMTLFSGWAERCYISIKRDLIKNNLIKVVSTEAYIENDDVIINYHFEDGTVYTPSADMSLKRFNKTQQKMLVKLAKEAAPHIFFVSCELVETKFKFIKESWNAYYDV